MSCAEEVRLQRHEARVLGRAVSPLWMDAGENTDSLFMWPRGERFSLTILSSWSPHGGFPTIRHNAIRDTTAQLLHQVCRNVSTEPTLQPLTGEQLQYRTANVEDHARLDVAASGLWGSRFERTLIDVRVFNPYARYDMHSPLSTCPLRLCVFHCFYLTLSFFTE